jgi:plasmid stabilization system protein ParE
MKVRYTRTALAEIEALFSYIEQNNPEAAAGVVHAIERTIARLAEFPQSAVATNIPDVRVAPAYPYPYLIFSVFLDKRS